MSKNVDKIKMYIKPTCTTCKKALKKLEESGNNFELVNYYKDKFTKKEIRELIDKMDVKPMDLLRKREKTYKELKLGEKQLTKNEIIDLLYENPDLIQRPIVEKGNKTYLARPAEKIDRLL